MDEERRELILAEAQETIERVSEREAEWQRERIERQNDPHYQPSLWLKHQYREKSEPMDLIIKTYVNPPADTPTTEAPAPPAVMDSNGLFSEVMIDAIAMVVADLRHEWRDDIAKLERRLTSKSADVLDIPNWRQRDVA